MIDISELITRRSDLTLFTSKLVTINRNFHCVTLNSCFTFSAFLTSLFPEPNLCPLELTFFFSGVVLFLTCVNFSSIKFLPFPKKNSKGILFYRNWYYHLILQIQVEHYCRGIKRWWTLKNIKNRDSECDFCVNWLFFAFHLVSYPLVITFLVPFGWN